MKKIILIGLMLVGIGTTSLIAQQPNKGQVKKSEVQAKNDFKKTEKERKKAEKQALKAQKKANKEALRASKSQGKINKRIK